MSGWIRTDTYVHHHPGLRVKYSGLQYPFPKTQTHLNHLKATQRISQSKAHKETAENDTAIKRDETYDLRKASQLPPPDSRYAAKPRRAVSIDQESSNANIPHTEQAAEP